ncbi:hypothetical protein BOTBODRAFT_187791 [Botryobasidium botryosum FD-172 SS1]|uniref:DRBM domain-containing protein n=1 Tax=Botryobasidium botryosum (strain FD-172 SS1) TaxID=930990 RepID=A0A067MI91_BOTB1|nr:hypothetical protein BOTBODRAFT_187791 [Botryobasidium botryosum FD-172 SS1]
MSASGTPTPHSFHLLHDYFTSTRQPQIPEEDWTCETRGPCHQAVWHATVKFRGQAFAGTGSTKRIAKDEAALKVLVEMMRVHPLPMSEQPHS